MHAMEELRKTLEKELEKIAAKGSINETDLAHVDKLTHSIKSIDTIVAMQEAGYSEDAYPYMYDGNSYARRRDSMGRYSRDDGYSNRRYGRDGDGDGRYHEGRYSRYDGGYSRGGNMREQLERMMQDASNETEREAIRQAMNRIS